MDAVRNGWVKESEAPKGGWITKEFRIKGKLVRQRQYESEFVLAWSPDQSRPFMTRWIPEHVLYLGSMYPPEHAPENTDAVVMGGRWEGYSKKIPPEFFHKLPEVPDGGN